MPINEWSRERTKGLGLLRADLATLTDEELTTRLRGGTYRDPRVRALAEDELARRQSAGADDAPSDQV